MGFLCGDFDSLRDAAGVGAAWPAGATHPAARPAPGVAAHVAELYAVEAIAARSRPASCVGKKRAAAVQQYYFRGGGWALDPRGWLVVGVRGRRAGCRHTVCLGLGLGLG